MFERVYRLDVNGETFIDGTQANKLRLVFDISISPGDSLQLGEISIYNLADNSVIKKGDAISLVAGYKDSYGVIFTGEVTNAFKERDRASIVRRLLCRSSMARTRGSANSTYGPNATIVDILKDIAAQWPLRLDIDASQFSSDPAFSSGYVADGDIPTILNRLGETFAFDWTESNGRLIVTKRGIERTSPNVIKIDMFTGMVGIPEVNRGPDGLGLFITSTLNPFIYPGTVMDVKSGYSTYSTGNVYFLGKDDDATATGRFSVFGVRHRGDTHGNQWVTEVDGLRRDAQTTAYATPTNGKLIWGAKVTQGFRVKVREICAKLGFDPNWLMAVMAFETGYSFSAQAKNKNSSATGLIQFLEKTATSLGTTTTALASMTEVEQLDYVYKYYQQYASQIKNIGDCYLAVLAPAFMGKNDSTVMWTYPSAEYNANSGLDVNHDGTITRGEAITPVLNAIKRGLSFVAG